MGALVHPGTQNTPLSSVPQYYLTGTQIRVGGRQITSLSLVYLRVRISRIAHSRVPGGFSNHWHHETRPKARNSVVKVNTSALPENLHLGQLLVFLVMCSWSPQQNDSGLCLERMALPALKLLKEWSCIFEPEQIHGDREHLLSLSLLFGIQLLVLQLHHRKTCSKAYNCMLESFFERLTQSILRCTAQSPALPLLRSLLFPLCNF